jgi:hypothetical protein
VYEQYRRCLAARDPKGNRQFEKILMLNREYPAEQVTDAVSLALTYNVYNYDGVLNILMQLNTNNPKVTPLRPELTVNIPQVHVLPPNLNKYSALMHNGGDM